MQDVWDIEVEEDHSYVAQGLIHHNSSANPNLQNLSPSIRPLFWAGEGRTFVECDLSNAETRVWAALSGDSQLQAALNEQDMHLAIAALVYGKPAESVTPDERTLTKRFVFGGAYGAGARTLAMKTGVSEQHAQSVLTAMKRAFPQAYQYMEAQKELALQQGYVSTFMGRKRRPSGLTSSNERVREEALLQAGNAPIQGTAVECCFVGWLKAVGALAKAGIDAHTEAQVHDSVLINVPLQEAERARDIVAKAMTDAIPQLGVPMPVKTEISERWGGDLAVEDVVKEVTGSELDLPANGYDNVDN